jgi:GTP-binding protein
LFILKDGRRRLHTSPAKLQDAVFKPQSWYWETEPPAKENLVAAAKFFKAHRPFREWTGTGWRRHKASTPGGLLVPEIIFLGRSNVGKSSLLNHVTYSSELNRVSQTPGATKTMWAWSLAAKDPINGGAIPGWGGDCRSKLTVVDMPGYGFGSDTEWGNEIITYMKNRRELRRAYIIVDALQGITKHDRKILDVLRSLTIPYQMIVSKCDKSGWHGSQTAVESALRPIREEAELGSSTHPGLGELLLVGGLHTGSSIRPYGVENLQWSILRATGLDKYAMSEGPAQKSPKPSRYNAGTIADSLAASRGQSFSSQLQQDLSKSATPSTRKAELSLQDFLAELLNVKRASDSPQQTVESSKSPVSSNPTPSLFSGGLGSTQSRPARSETDNPVDRKLVDLLAASRGASQESTSTPIKALFASHTQPASTATSSSPSGKGRLHGADSFSAMSGVKASTSFPAIKRVTHSNPKPAFTSPAPTNRSAPPSGKGVSRGLEAFESMFDAQTPRGRKGSRAARSAPPPPLPRKPAGQVSIGKGVTQGLDAFESMFAAEAPKHGGGKNRNRRRH